MSDAPTWRDVRRLYECGDVLGTRAAMRDRERVLAHMLDTLRALGCTEAREGLTGAGLDHGERYGQLDTCHGCQSYICPEDPQIEAGGWPVCVACALDPGLWTCQCCGAKRLRDGRTNEAICEDCADETLASCDIAIARLKREETSK